MSRSLHRLVPLTVLFDVVAAVSSGRTVIWQAFRPTDRTHSSRLPIPPIKVHVRLVWNRVFTRPSARGSLRGSTLDLRASIVFYVKPPATT